MAAPALKMAGPKKSFASVAAMAPPSQTRQNVTKSDDKAVKSAHLVPTAPARMPPLEGASTLPVCSDLSGSLGRLGIQKDSGSSQEQARQESNGFLQNGSTNEDEKSQLSYSSNKAPSLDGKSVASCTTFAMDEKESLRPDDSASLKAVEEDDSNSGQASAAPSSRMGSEAGGKAFRDQFNEISERIDPSGHRTLPLSRRVLSDNLEEMPHGSLASMTSAIPAAAPVPRTEPIPAGVSVPLFNYQEPDEKLVEAMETPKDRLFLLQLEQQVISFIRDSQDPVLDLPPCNSFCRLLAHRLGDYYALTHYVDNAVSAVRLYRTPYCRLPNPLSTYSKQPEVADGALSSQPSMKIMRRSGLGVNGQNPESGANTVASSLGPSKAGSETGDEDQRVSGVTSPTDSTTAKDKASMTREEREAKYKETRERIFGGLEESQNADYQVLPDVMNEDSRTSSASGKRKAKKSKQIDDDFEARSSYNAYWPNMQYSTATYNQAVNPTTYYNPYMQQANDQASHSGVPQTYSQPYQALPQLSPYQIPVPQAPAPNSSSTYLQNYGYVQNNSPLSYGSYAQQHSPQYYQSISQQNPMVSPSTAVQSPALNHNAQLSRPQSQMSDQSWTQNSFSSPGPYSTLPSQQAPYQQQSHSHMNNHLSTTTSPMSGGSYPYGQLPFQSNAQPSRSQHPLPGSYNRQNFNPQTRAFIPSNPSFATQQPLASAIAPTEPLGYRPNPLHQSAGGLPPYGQPSNLNLPVPYLPQAVQYTQTHINPSYPQSYSQRRSSGQTPRSQSPGQSSLSTWARPENLPPKPPPSEVSSKPNNGNQGGQSMPKFHNGTYTKSP
ncbi:hypothetical protein MMC13_003967 [Lambiella insularis]|nr:hypothetical protein [Lambiella insularis]